MKYKNDIFPEGLLKQKQENQLIQARNAPAHLGRRCGFFRIYGGSGSLRRSSASGCLMISAFPRNPAYFASSAPRALHCSSASSSGASMQITLSAASVIPSETQRSSQERIHSPSPQP